MEAEAMMAVRDGEWGLPLGDTPTETMERELYELISRLQDLSVYDSPQAVEAIKVRNKALADRAQELRDMSLQTKAGIFYRRNDTQIVVAVIIGCNFVVNCVEACILPETEEAKRVFTVFEWIFNSMFFIELCLNMFGHWFWRFWGSGWNVF